MKTNVKFKSSVFSLLFSEPDILRELYCALKGVTLPGDVPVVINTLEDVLFMDRINDISFEIDGRLVVLIEHQSTVNPNIALRLLMYIARVYEKTVGDRNIYSGKKLTIPQPEFFVLYNGVAPFPDKSVLKLSDMFTSVESLGLPGTARYALELEVTVLNVNAGKNEAIVNRCRHLAQYSAFIAKVREYERKGNSLQEAVKKAVVYCRDHAILKELLEEHASEVLNMLTTEWNLDDAKKVWFEDGFEEGMEKGMEKGIVKGREEGRGERDYEIARNMKTRGRPAVEIAEDTGLSLETIERL